MRCKTRLSCRSDVTELKPSDGLKVKWRPEALSHKVVDGVSGCK